MQGKCNAYVREWWVPNQPTQARILDGLGIEHVTLCARKKTKPQQYRPFSLYTTLYHDATNAENGRPSILLSQPTGASGNGCVFTHGGKLRCHPHVYTMYTSIGVTFFVASSMLRTFGRRQTHENHGWVAGGRCGYSSMGLWVGTYMCVLNQCCNGITCGRHRNDGQQ